MIESESGNCLCEGIKSDNIGITKSGCHGFCEMGPLVRIEPAGILYCGVKLEDVEEIVEETLLNDREIERLLYHHPVTGEAFRGRGRDTVLQETDSYSPVQLRSFGS